MSFQKKLFIEQIQPAGKRVIVRVDFNVPLKDGVVESDKRLRESLPTIEYLRKNGARVILMSHLGRPDGKRAPDMSLAPVAKALGTLLGATVQFASDCVGEPAQSAVAKLAPGDVLLLENLRFHAAEEDNDAGFAKQLAELADIYVNDAFGTAHRAHASTEGITKFTAQAAAGYLMKKELDYLGQALASPVSPFVSIIGGSKISSKIDVIKNLLPRVDTLLLGGGMTYTFMKAQGLEVGKSIVENDKVDFAKSLLDQAAGKLVLPDDFVVTDKLDFKARTVGALKTVPKDGIPTDWEAVDIGPQSVAKFASILMAAKTVIWNGPVGVFEIDATSKGTIAIAEILAKATAG
ncbi:MAG TPA: phosphoglycerate kinase, partial [Polyangiaceae bacterium]|nr:phosphoglycerate kinase [Polyangiaceae bacterium]